MSRHHRFLPVTTLLAALLCVTSSLSFGRDDNPQIRSAIEHYLRSQTANLPGQASFKINGVEGSPSRPPCPNLDVSMAPGARALGRTTVLVRCRADNGWAIYVPVRIQVISEYVVSTRPLSQGQLISEADLTRQSGDLGDLPSGVLLDPSQAIGRIVGMPIPAGRPVLRELLRQPPVIQAGQTVKVVSRGPGFEVTNEGRALTGAAEGKVVQVRLHNGQVVSGIARSGGSVEITF